MASSVPIVRLYRVLYRQSLLLLPKSGDSCPLFLLQKHVEPAQVGSSRITSIPTVSSEAVLRWFNNRLEDQDFNIWLTINHAMKDLDADDEDTVIWTCTSTIQEAIRQSIRIPGGRMEWAIRAYQILLEQTNILKSFSSRVERGIRIAATSHFVESYSGKYRFVYRIRIENLSSSNKFQLLGRSWFITEDQSSDAICVHAPTGGAVGQFPILAKGKAFEYVSSCELVSANGMMKGVFHFRDLSCNESFEFTVKPFRLKAEIS